MLLEFWIAFGLPLMPKAYGTVSGSEVGPATPVMSAKTSTIGIISNIQIMFKNKIRAYHTLNCLAGKPLNVL